MKRFEGRSVLVTGGAGFLGSAVVTGLVGAGARVRSLDDNSRGAPERLAHLGHSVELVAGDVRDPAVVSAALGGVECVFHLAYVNGTEFFYTKPDVVLDVAVRGMMSVLDGCRANGVRELVLASSSEVYQTPPHVPTAETVPLCVPDPLNPRYSYGGGKIISELLALHHGAAYLDRVVIFRPHNVYGPDMGFEHVIPALATRICELSRPNEGKVRLPIQGTGAESRAFVFIDDMVDGVLRVAAEGAHRGIYHVGSEEEISIGELASLIGEIIGAPVELVPGPLRPGGTPRRCPDIAKMRALGFAPKVDLRAGLRKTVPWYVDAWRKRT